MIDAVGSSVQLENPFPGLRSFTVDESHLFFGRDGQSDELLRKMDRSRFVAVVGVSGREVVSGACRAPSVAFQRISGHCRT